MNNRARNHDGRVSRGEALYDYVRHPHVHARKAAGPVKVADQHSDGNALTRFNARLALAITKAVGTMWCAYGFALFDMISLPAAIHQGIAAVATWVAQAFLQLVLLSIIMVGQNVQGAAADKRAEATFLDAEAVLEDARQIQEHLAVQDAELAKLGAVHALVSDLHGQLAQPPSAEGTAP